MTRRDLAKLAGATAFLQKQTLAADSAYTGPLDGYLDKVNGAGFDPILFGRKLYESAALRMSFAAQNRRDAEQWQKNLRAKITELLGGFPVKNRPSSPKRSKSASFQITAAKSSSSRAAPIPGSSATCSRPSPRVPRKPP